MFKEQMNKIKSLIIKKDDTNKNQKNDKRKIENLIVFLIVLIITLIAINMILKGGQKQNEDTDSPYKELATENTVSTKEVSYNELEMKIDAILETMSGVRKSKCFGYIFSDF